MADKEDHTSGIGERSQVKLPLAIPEQTSATGIGVPLSSNTSTVCVPATSCPSLAGLMSVLVCVWLRDRNGHCS